MKKAVTFDIDSEVAKQFKVRCAELDSRQWSIIELLMIKWLKESKNYGSK